jgi:UDP-N-acetylmuramate dehydrogenase
MNLDFQENVSLKPYNTFGIDVSARWFCSLDNVEALPALLNSAQFRSGPVLWLGGGSNLLFTKNFPGLVVRLTLSGQRILSEDTDSVLIEAAAGEQWHPFVLATLAKGWCGLENLSLIPGTVGAAPIQNIGAYGVEVKQTLQEVVCADLNDYGKLVTLANADCRFGYRDSVFKHEQAGKLLILAVRFKLSKTATVETRYGDISGELERMGIHSEPTPQQVSDAVIRIRSSKLPNPLELGNAGSFFKNPIIDAKQAEDLLTQYPQMPHYPATDGKVKLAAGWLIDQAGLKGYRVGDAGVHAKQALVLVNYGTATGNDIWAMAEHVRATVRQKYGVILEPEPVVL